MTLTGRKMRKLRDFTYVLIASSSLKIPEGRQKCAKLISETVLVNPKIYYMWSSNYTRVSFGNI